jgi:hypothetical protein
MPILFPFFLQAKKSYKKQELASLEQPGFFNDNKFDFLNGNFFRREEFIW